jgi:hypothetical protein
VPEFASRRTLMTLFVPSIYPNPILTPLVLGMGATRFSFWKCMLTVWAGKTAQGLLLSCLGYFGLRSLLRFFGIFQTACFIQSTLISSFFTYLAHPPLPLLILPVIIALLSDCLKGRSA